MKEDRAGLFEQIITENFPNLGSKQAFKSRKHRTRPPPPKMNTNRSILKHTTVKLVNFRDKEKILKAA